MVDAFGKTIRQLRRLSGTRFAGALCDAELVARVVQQRDEAAFEVLVWRHGPMVLRVCRRVLRHQQDAEDALQATFLVLFRKLHTLGKRPAIGAWLHRVAFRVALRSRKNAQRRRADDHAVDSLPAPTASERTCDDVLDREINRLPERLRRVVVLCLLEERSYAEAAAVIGCPLGTVQSRLARARQLLQARLAKHGVTAAVAAVAAADIGAATVPRHLVLATLHAAAAFRGAGGLVTASVASLTRQTLRAIWLARWGGRAVKALSLIGVGIACWSGAAMSDPPPAARTAPAGSAIRPRIVNADTMQRVALRRDLALIEGEWQLVAGVEDGLAMPTNKIQATVLTFLPDQRVSLGCRRPHDRFILEPQTQPPRLRLTVAQPDGEVSSLAGIYEVTEKSLRVCLGNADRPAVDFASAPGSGQRLWTFRRPGAEKQAAAGAILE